MPRLDEANPFGELLQRMRMTCRADPGQQPGHERSRHAEQRSLKLDFATAAGTLTSVSAYNSTRGNPHRRRVRLPAARHRLFTFIFGTTSTRASSSTSRSYSQEFRYTSPTEGRLRWIARRVLHAHGPLHLDRQHAGPRHGRCPVYREPSTNRSTRRSTQRRRSERRSSPIRRTTMPGRCSRT